MVTRPTGDNDWTLLRVRDAAKRLACSPATIYALIEASELPVVQVGRRKGYRIDPRDLDAFVSARKFRFEAPPAAPPPKGLKHLKL